jgi:hypothetical protein
MAKVTIHIDNYKVESGSRIMAYTLIDGQDIDFCINKEEFEAFCDEHELRYWEHQIYNYEKEDFDEFSGTEDWTDIYDGPEFMRKFIKSYIQHLYDMDAMDIEKAIKKIA